MDSAEAVFAAEYGCKCDSETVIFCFDKRTGDCKWSCSGHCFERLPSQTTATQTEDTARSLSQTCRTNSTEAEDKELAYQMMKSNAGSSYTTSVAVSRSSPNQQNQVICFLSDDVRKPQAAKKASISVETCNEVQNMPPGQLSFDDLGSNNVETLDDVYDNGDVRDGSSSNYEHAVGGNIHDKRDIHVDATTDGNNAEDQNNTQFDSDDGKDVDYVVSEGDESDNDRRHNSVDISNSPTKVRKSIGGKQRKKVGVPREVFPCSYCTRKCTTQTIYEKHIEWHTRSKETKCNICGKEFSKPGYLINHQEKHQQARKHGEEASEGTVDSVNKEKKLAECRYCGKLMKGGEILNKHEKTHEPRQKRVMECSYCGKTFTSKKDFARHVRTHTKERPYKCNQCDSAFYSNSDLTIHIRRHLGDKRYKCDHCGKAFVRKCNLDDHLRTHTGARPYKCDYCNKSFGFRNVLKVHLIQHTGVRPHICEYCNKGFAKKAFLDKHLMSHYD